MAQGKANDIKTDLSTIEANLAIESSAALQKLQKEAEKEKPTVSDGSTEKMIKKKVNFVEKKMKAITELNSQAQLSGNEEFLNNNLSQMKTILTSTEKAMSEINDKIRAKQRQNENTGAVSDAEWEKQMNFVLKE